MWYIIGIIVILVVVLVIVVRKKGPKAEKIAEQGAPEPPIEETVEMPETPLETPELEKTEPETPAGGELPVEEPEPVEPVETPETPEPIEEKTEE